MRGVDRDRYLNINIILDTDTAYCDHFGTHKQDGNIKRTPFF
jgi:hypothetical protein